MTIVHKLTSPPWFAHRAVDGSEHEWSLQSAETAFLLFNFHPDVPEKERRAIANKLAAASEMYEALKHALNELKEYEWADTGETYNSPKISAALAKAESQNEVTK